MNLELSELQQKAHDYGFIHLSIEDSIRLLKITESEFKEQYIHYYKLGISKNKETTLRMYYDKSIERLETLTEYMNSFSEVKVSEKIQVENEPISTIELIDKLKKIER